VRITSGTSDLTSTPYLNYLLLVMSDSLDSLENTWWISSPEVYPSYEAIPPMRKLLLRTTNGALALPGSPQQLLMWTSNGQEVHFPPSYTASLMLLAMQEMSCLAEIWKLAGGVANPYWQNVYFIWNLRDHLLERSSSPDFITDDKMDPLLCRWLVRLLHGYQNCSSERVEKRKELTEQYERYCNGGELLGDSELFLYIIPRTT